MRPELFVGIEADCLIIRLPIATLAFAAEQVPIFPLKVLDHSLFAASVVNALCRESEDGSTPVTQMIDAACEIAAEDCDNGTNWEEEMENDDSGEPHD